MADLFHDWTSIVRSLGKIPTYMEYEERSKYSLHPLRARFGSWLHVPAGLKQYADEQGLTTEWADVRKLVEEYARRQKGSWRMAAAQPVPSLMIGQPVYGEFTGWSPLVCAPTNDSSTQPWTMPALPERVKENASAVFQRLGEAEAGVHQPRIQVELPPERSKSMVRHDEQYRAVVHARHRLADRFVDLFVER